MATVFLVEFLRGLVGRGLKGIKLVIADVHEGAKRRRSPRSWAPIHRLCRGTSCATCSATSRRASIPYVADQAP